MAAHSQYSGLENCRDYMVHGVAKSRTHDWATYPFTNWMYYQRTKADLGVVLFLCKLDTQNTIVNLFYQVFLPAVDTDKRFMLLEVKD